MTRITFTCNKCKKSNTWGLINGNCDECNDAMIINKTYGKFAKRPESIKPIEEILKPGDGNRLYPAGITGYRLSYSISVSPETDYRPPVVHFDVLMRGVLVECMATSATLGMDGVA